MIQMNKWKRYRYVWWLNLLKKRIIKKRNLSTAGFLFSRKKIRFIIGPLVSHIFYLKVNWVIPLLRTALRFKKNVKTHVCRIMFKIYNFKTLSSFNLLLNKMGGGMNTNFCGKTYLSPITPEITCTSVNKIQNVFISRIWSSR